MSRIARYVSLVCIAAVWAGVFLYLRNPVFSISYAQAALTFGFIGVLTQLFSYRTGRGSMGSVSFIPVLASAAIAPHWLSVIVVAAASLAGQVVAKRDRIRTVFNTAQESLALALAIWAYQGFVGVAFHNIGET